MADIMRNHPISASPDVEAACAGCFLNEITGGVCPAARSIETLKELRTAVQADAGSVMSFADLIRHDAEALVRTKAVLALMPGATATAMFPNTEKEVEVVQVGKR